MSTRWWGLLANLTGGYFRGPPAPGCHARASWIAQQLNQELGIFVRAARNTALCTLAEDLPAPILADLLGMHITTAVRWTKLVKRDWTHYLAERVTPTVPVGH